MAFQISFTTDDGVTHPQCCCRLHHFTLFRDGSGEIAFSYWHDATTAGSGTATALRTPSYALTKAQVAAHLAPALIAANGLVAQLYALAAASIPIFEGALNV